MVFSCIDKDRLKGTIRGVIRFALIKMQGHPLSHSRIYRDTLQHWRRDHRQDKENDYGGEIFFHRTKTKCVFWK